MEERFYFKEIVWPLRNFYKAFLFFPLSYIFYFLFVIIPYPLVCWYQRNSYVVIKNGFLIYTSFGKEVWKTKISDIKNVDKEQIIVTTKDPLYTMSGFFIKMYDPDYQSRQDIYADKIIVRGEYVNREEFLKTKVVRVRHILEDYEYFISKLLEINPNIIKSEVHLEYGSSDTNIDLRKLFYQKTKNIFPLNLIGKILLQLGRGTIYFLIFLFVFFVTALLIVHDIYK